MNGHKFVAFHNKEIQMTQIRQGDVLLQATTNIPASAVEIKGEIVLNEGIYRQGFQVEDFGTEVRHVTD